MFNADDVQRTRQTRHRQRDYQVCDALKGYLPLPRRGVQQKRRTRLQHDCDFCSRIASCD